MWRHYHLEAEQFLHRALGIQTRAHGERHPETGRVLCALAQVYKRMCHFERAARYDRLWRLCPPLAKQPKGPRLAAVAASNAAAADAFSTGAGHVGQHHQHRPTSTTLGLLLSQKIHPTHPHHQQHQVRPASPTGSVASELADPLLGHFSGDLQERVPKCGGLVVPPLDLSRLPEPESSSDEEEEEEMEEEDHRYSYSYRHSPDGGHHHHHSGNGGYARYQQHHGERY